MTGNGNKVEEAVRSWRGSIVEDGSLPTTGFEINTAPASGDKYSQQINRYCEELHKAGATINTKCGLHVHVDAREFNYYDLRRLARVYAAIEPALFRMVPESRRNSRFAKRCGDEYLDAMRWGKFPYSQVKADILKSTYRLKNIDRTAGRDLKKMKKSKYQDARYAALNIHSWFFRGTIECRLFNGTLNAEKIINWGVMWAMILDYVTQHTDEFVEEKLPLTDEASYDNLVSMISSNGAVRDFVKSRYEQYSKDKEKPAVKPRKRRTVQGPVVMTGGVPIARAVPPGRIRITPGVVLPNIDMDVATVERIRTAMAATAMAATAEPIAAPVVTQLEPGYMFISGETDAPDGDNEAWNRFCSDHVRISAGVRNGENEG